MNIFEAGYRPLGDNPYPESHPAHKAFEQANRQAEFFILEELTDTTDLYNASPSDRMKWAVRSVVERFKIEAGSALQVVINPETHRHYVNFLSQNAMSSIEDACLMAKQLRKERSLLKFPVRGLRIILTPLIHDQVIFFRLSALLRLKTVEDSSQEESTSSPMLNHSGKNDFQPPSSDKFQADSVRQARRSDVQSYIKEVFDKTGKRITKTDIWKSARYKTRTEFERWERNDPKATKTAGQRFSEILTEKPHLQPLK